MAYIYEYIKRFYSKTINEGIFYDLGSGTGKAIIAMSLMHKFKKVIGLEYLENLIKPKIKNKWRKRKKTYFNSKWKTKFNRNNWKTKNWQWKL